MLRRKERSEGQKIPPRELIITRPVRIVALLLDIRPWPVSLRNNEEVLAVLVRIRVLVDYSLICSVILDQLCPLRR